MQLRLLILTGGHLAFLPRTQKEAAAARAAGFDVAVRGIWWDEQLAAEDRDLADSIGVDFRPAADIRPGRPGRTLFRLRQRLARELYRRFKCVTPRCFGLGAPELLREAQRTSADLTMVHLEAGLWAGGRLLDEGRRVGVDFEDWYSEDLPDCERRFRPVAALRQLEEKLLAKALLCLATSHAMARAMAAEAGAGRLPAVIPNSFRSPSSLVPLAEQGRDPTAVSFYWFSQTVGPDRGLETLANALPLLTGRWQLHLRGKVGGYEAWFERTFKGPTRQRVLLHPCVPNTELPSHTAGHDVGLALESPYCRNRNLTATNKLFEYLRSGLAVIATMTEGQMEVMAKAPGAGWMVAAGDARHLAEVMQRCIDDRTSLEEARAASAAAARQTWGWEHFAPALANLLRSAATSQRVHTLGQ